jgi:hypothetical protein
MKCLMDVLVWEEEKEEEEEGYKVTRPVTVHLAVAPD